MKGDPSHAGNGGRADSAITEFKVSDRTEHALNFFKKQRERWCGQRSERDVLEDEGREGGEMEGRTSQQARGLAMEQSLA